MSKILITGGSGLVGQAISRLLIAEGHSVVWLSRTANEGGGIRQFKWDIERGTIDPLAFEGVEHIIHLAGANIAAHRWTKRYKKEIINSRVRSAALLAEHLIINRVQLKSFTGASAVGYYGARLSDRVFSEAHEAGNDFLAEVCIAWEKSYEPFITMGIRTSILRCAVVLTKKDAALKKMLPAFKLGFGAAIAKGDQAFPWIHINDLARLYINTCFITSYAGIYNAASPEKTTNAEFSATLARVLDRPLLLPNIPEWALRLVIGEAATALSTGVSVNVQKLLDTGFAFRFPGLEQALRHLLRKST